MLNIRKSNTNWTSNYHCSRCYPKFSALHANALERLCRRLEFLWWQASPGFHCIPCFRAMKLLDSGSHMLLRQWPQISFWGLLFYQGALASLHTVSKRMTVKISHVLFEYFRPFTFLINLCSLLRVFWGGRF